MFAPHAATIGRWERDTGLRLASPHRRGHSRNVLAGRAPDVAGTLTRLDALRDRCTMTTVDPDTFERDPEVLKEIVRRFGGRLALDADVVRGGTVRIGDDALIEEHASDRSVIVRR